MKSEFPVLVALILLTSACSSFEYPSSAMKLQPRNLGVRTTQWGELHEYSFHGPPQLAQTTQVNTAGLNGVAVVDLLVSPEGKVLDASVVESSGSLVVDAAARASYAGTVFPHIPGYSSTAPYVIQSKLEFKGDSTRSDIPMNQLVSADKLDPLPGLGRSPR